MSAEHEVLMLTTFVNYALGQGFKVASIFLDIVKAFYTVDHLIIFGKLKNYGIGGKALKLLESFSSGRTQYAEISGAKSTERVVEFGVPRGLVLDPFYS